ncbi:serine--tRNA ligase [candidate division WOR-1 bacterium RIFOXYC2_FULL_37_10]|uniref:Serine--tRNA ligase n=1 Tax=candidate division WOR-1 bacterium RIFOXYB2_FULL_37_13 TaxID=1802579 RepID=A0A1F4SMT6_UNCSA|nr:MAG: serine--tRNA ligase [candidate division WOR-1 bacterium RIFOXYA2_FULL_37_7]OGC21720.1 MAG: serine--tRNA ligase [candidate division WOR-1 bacterium RIFOXYB2_FULL_37_13]OGC32583.1 MAG: serine--tRNA ligase [candidate division WOR-1 bacterium RIFOXYC2_FULL_37_10]
MLDSKLLRENPKKVMSALKNRQFDTSLIDKVAVIDKKWREAVFKAETLKKQRNENSKEVGKLKKEGKAADDLLEKTRLIGDEIKKIEEDLGAIEVELNQILFQIPNIPFSSVPVGKDESSNKEIRKWGNIPSFSFKPKAHDEIGVALGILNFKEAVKLSGARFVVYHKLGAALERALISFMIDVHTKENGYEEVLAPVLVKAHSLLGTGQLPKFEEDLFKCSDDFYLIPTAEVSVTNLHRDEIIDYKKLPIKYCSYSPCFRREAGSYGKDTKGIIRQHQFNKVELVKFTDPAKSYDELESLTKNAEMILQKLNLPYRVVELCTGDLGFSSARTYDIEVWFPSEGRYREISSCSNFEDFQARRAGIKFKKDAGSKPEYVHTLNGSGLAVGRTFAAILENCQREDGAVLIPQILKPYLGIDAISAVY